MSGKWCNIASACNFLDKESLLGYDYPMENKNLIYGAKSGIQKAIRRGNLDLAKTCFDVLWAEKAERNWLKWRLPILVQEEAWYMAGELTEFLETQKGSAEEWKKFIFRLAIAPKNKDAGGLAEIGRLRPSFIIDEQNEEVEAIIHWADKAGDSPETVASELAEACIADSSLTDYEIKGIQTFEKRCMQGGMVADKWGLLAGMILIACRRMLKKDVKTLEEKGLPLWKEHFGRKPKTINLPWYVFDMHTGIGKWALNIFMKRTAKKFGIELRSDLFDIWFCFSSGFVPPYLHKELPLSDASIATIEEEIWWPAIVPVLLTAGEVETMADAEKIWSKIHMEIKALVL